MVCMSAGAIADEMVLEGTLLERIKIVDLEGSEIAYRNPAGDLVYSHFAQVDWLSVSSVGSLRDLNEAENMVRAGKFGRAIQYYERALRVAPKFWKKLVRARLVRAAERSGRLDTLVAQFVALTSVVEGGPELASCVFPGSSPVGEVRGGVRALRNVNEAIDRASSQSDRVLLEMLRYQIARILDDPSKARYAEALADQPIPPAVGNRSVYRVKARALLEAVGSIGREAAVGVINGELSRAAMEVLPEMLLVKAELLLAGARSDEDLIRSAWPAMRIVIHYPSDPLVPKALMLAAKVHERLGRNELAIKLLNECVRFGGIADSDRDRASAEISRLTVAGS
jgi:tetratricopeptide (TPR) repeat protein